MKVLSVFILFHFLFALGFPEYHCSDLEGSRKELAKDLDFARERHGKSKYFSATFDQSSREILFA